MRPRPAKTSELARITYVQSLFDLNDNQKVLFEVKQFLCDVMDITEQSIHEEIIIELYNRIAEDLDGVNERG